MQNNYITISFFLFSTFLFSQNKEVEKLEEIVINSSRIEVPFKESSRTITVITRKDIENSTANNVADLLQQYAGVDVRRRGIDGMQSDLYIRGGSFDQTLVLIDGIKTENPQTGHHSMNIMIPIENIERIEIIKGPAARVFGQNAFTGAINIVTKKNISTQLKAEAAYGSYHTATLGLTGGLHLKTSSHLLHVSRNVSDGYRYNTDFENVNIFIKSKLNTAKIPIDIIATFMERKFGANGFYASPSFEDQYEETQASLVGVTSSFSKNNFTFKPKLYWKRGQDMYEFVRDKPEIYRNLHITNKVGGAIDASFNSTIGTTGFGIDIAKVTIVSNNLGNHDRTMVTGFLEQKLQWFDNKLDVTPGVALTYYSDFDFQAFPGIDVGYAINNQFRVYGNLGYTYRIPTYTDLYFSSPTTLGNENLNPEKAFAEEIGVKYNTNNITASAVLFYRNAKDLIDYVKMKEADKWQAENLAEVITKGVELEMQYTFKIAKFSQKLNLGYTFLEDDVLAQEIPFSRYSLNSIKNQLVAGVDSQFFKHFKQNLTFRLVERPDGTSYNILDFKVTATYTNIELSAVFNNIFNTEYTETNLVPMPKSNALFILKYTFK